MLVSLVVVLILSVVGYFLGDAIIKDMQGLFIKAGLFGKDLNKKEETKM